MPRDVRQFSLVWFPAGRSQAENVCPKCLDRARWEEKTIDEWRPFGFPRSADTYCLSYCRCLLLPSGGIRLRADISRVDKQIVTAVKRFAVKESIRRFAEFEREIDEYLKVAAEKFQGVRADDLFDLDETFVLPREVLEFQDITESIRFLADLKRKIKFDKLDGVSFEIVKRGNEKWFGGR